MTANRHWPVLHRLWTGPLTGSWGHATATKFDGPEAVSHCRGRERLLALPGNPDGSQRVDPVSDSITCALLAETATRSLPDEISGWFSEQPRVDHQAIETRSGSRISVRMEIVPSGCGGPTCHGESGRDGFIYPTRLTVSSLTSRFVSPARRGVATWRRRGDSGAGYSVDRSGRRVHITDTTPTPRTGGHVASSNGESSPGEE